MEKFKTLKLKGAEILGEINYYHLSIALQWSTNVWMSERTK